MTNERHAELLRQIEGQPDDQAMLFICPWMGPEITCGELRELLSSVPSQRPEKTADDAPTDVSCDPREAWALGFNAAMGEVWASSTSSETPTREGLIGYLAQCYRATGSIQTDGCSDEEAAGHAVSAVEMLARRTQRGTYYDDDSRTWIAREIVTSAGRTEEEARAALRSAIGLLAETWPPRDGEAVIDALAQIGSELLCETCAKVFCPHGERLHFHHDGCPACDANDYPLLPSCVIGEYCRRHQFIHGAEAEEFRSKLHALIERSGGDVSDHALRDLLNDVDARDSLALLEAGAEERPTGETPDERN